VSIHEQHFYNGVLDNRQPFLAPVIQANCGPQRFSSVHLPSHALEPYYAEPDFPFRCAQNP